MKSTNHEPDNSKKTFASFSIETAQAAKDWSGQEKRQEFYIPVHGFVWFYPEELEIIDHPAFQRLAGMHQLGLAYLVFRGATHKRFEHVLGTVAIAQRMVDAANHNCNKHARQFDYDLHKAAAHYRRVQKASGAKLYRREEPAETGPHMLDALHDRAHTEAVTGQRATLTSYRAARKRKAKPAK